MLSRIVPPVMIRTVAAATAGVLLAATLVLVGAPTAEAASVTESEPNGAISTADVVPLGGSVSGSTLGTSYFDSDYYAVDLPADGRLNVKLTFPANLGAGPAYEVSVYSANGDQQYDFDVTGDQSDGSGVLSQAMFAAKGRSYVRISGDDDRATWGAAYTLGLASTAGLVETTPNGSTSTADVVALGATITGSALGTSYFDGDYYAVDLPADGRLNVKLTFPSNLGAGPAYEVSVYSANGEEQYDFDVTGDEFDGSGVLSYAMFAAKGRSYVRVSGDDDWATWGTAYTLSVTSKAGTVETTPNGSTSTADVLALGGTISGSALGTSYFDGDYYAVDTSATGRVRIDFRFPSGLGAGSAYEITVYNSAGNTLYDYDLTGDLSDGSWLRSQVTTLTKGRSYIRISGDDDWATWGKAYTLSVSALTSTATPKIVGTPKVGQQLTAQPGTWSPAPVSFAYQWFRSGKAIAGATKSTYTLATADAGTTVSVAVTGSKPGYVTVTKTSSGASVPLQKLTATATPTISGTVKVGSVLTAKPGTWSPSPVALTYQWLRNGKAISGATKGTYTLAKADAGTSITVTLTGRKAGFSSVSKTSAAKAVPLK